MTDPTHPTDDVLVKLAEGRLAGAELEQLEQHIDSCGACRTLLAVVSNGSAPSASIERAALSPGEKLGRYEIERLIGAGGMGMLYVARDPQLGRRVALKQMRPAFNDELGRVRLLREAQAMAQLSHPNVVHVYELGELSGRVFIAMELLEGGTLREWMKTPRTWRETLSMFVAAGDGLYAAHQSGVVHRDFKPENVMLGKDGRPRVGDFGLARPELVAEEEPPKSPPMRITQFGAILGTPAYMSPEQLSGKPADALSDQYGFCVALYEALAGKRPFPTDSMAELRQMVLGGMPPPPKDGPVPAHVWAAIARGLHPDPAKRFADLGELLTVLRLGAEPLALPKKRSRAVIARNLAIAAVACGLLSLLATKVGSLPSGPNPPVAVGLAVPVAAATPVAPVAATPAPPAAANSEEPVDPPSGSADLPAFKGPRVPLPAQLELDPGEERVFDVEGLERVAIGDTDLVDVKTVGGSQVLLIGGEDGHTTLLTWAKGKRHSTAITVKRGAHKPRPDDLVLTSGDQKALDIKGIVRVAVGDDEVADAKTIGSDELLVVGNEPGFTGLVVWTDDGQRLERGVRVKPSGKVAAAAADGELYVAIGGQKVITVRGVQRIAVGDSRVCDVKTIGNDQLLLIGAGEGTTTLLIWSGDGSRLSYTVHVPKPMPPPTAQNIGIGVTESYPLPRTDYRHVTSSTPGIVKVVAEGHGKVHLEALATGRAEVVAEQTDGTRTVYFVEVSGK